jgi:hypothetical protein
MSSAIALQIGAQAIEAFVAATKIRDVSVAENESFLNFAAEYAKAVTAHLGGASDFNFTRFKIAAETMRARFMAPEAPPGDCGTEEGCEGCQNHFCKRRWAD